MNINQLSRLERVNLRDIWKNESSNFTPWLAQEDNLALLSETLRMNLQLEGIEVAVGSFKADILCKDLFLDKLVLIENQLEPTDHSHLGQVLTYAAGLRASIIVWICQEFNEEHRAAIDWLNENTGNDTHFFGIEIEAWKIENSLPAPKFNIVSQPNEWSCWINEATKKYKSAGLSKTQELYLNYWTDLALTAKNLNGLRPQKPRTENYFTFSTGKSNVVLAAKADMREKFIGVELYFSGLDAKKYYSRLFEDKDSIENEAGFLLDWQEMPQKMASRILLKHENTSIECQEDWKNQHVRLCESMQLFQKVLLPRINTYEFK